MFSHKGKSRTDRHNLGIASILGFVAGMVNIVGFLAVHKLTTNVTGHFAYFVDAALGQNFRNVFYVGFYIFSFFLGAFSSSIVVQIYLRRRENLMYVIPTIVEALILAGIAFFGDYLIETNPSVIAFSLLFAMGMQNALVTSISKAVVRTTHLTGLFTDMGIEFAQLFFYRSHAHRNKLFKSIRLRLTIIWMFFGGGVAGGILYGYFGIKTLLFATSILLLGLVYDFLKVRLSLLRHKI